MDWCAWIGPWRVVSSALAVVAVCVGAYWLTRTPPPSTEASLPQATVAPMSTTAPMSTLPAPTSASIVGEASRVTVHVAGAVRSPGLYELPSGARVADAIALAGGPIADGDADALNLAAPAVDGSRIYVPAVGEEVPPASVGQAAAAGPVDVNRATAEQLDELPGVGPATATAIVTERERNGPFLTVDDLERVPGIGSAKLDAIRDLITT